MQHFLKLDRWKEEGGKEEEEGAEGGGSKM